MAGWHHCLDGHESKWTPGVGNWQGGLACCNSRGRKKSDTTERLIWSDLLLFCRENAASETHYENNEVLWGFEVICVFCLVLNMENENLSAFFYKMICHVDNVQVKNSMYTQNVVIWFHLYKVSITSTSVEKEVDKQLPRAGEGVYVFVFAGMVEVREGNC